MRLFRFSIIIFVCTLFAGCHQTARVEGIPFARSLVDGWGLMDCRGKIIVPSGSYGQMPSPVVNGRFTVASADGSVRLYDIACPQEPLSLRKFQRIGYFFDEVTVAQEKEDTPLLLIDRNGQTVAVLDFSPMYDLVEVHNFCEGRALVKTSQGRYGYVDAQGKLVIPPVYSEASSFSEGKALVGLSDRQGRMGFQVIDTDGNVLFPLRYADALYAGRYTEGRLLAYSQTARQWSYLDDRGRMCLFLPDTLSGAFPFRKGVAVTASKEGYGLIGRKGDLLLSACYKKVCVVTDKRAAALVKGKWNLYDWENKDFFMTELDTVPLYLSSELGIARVGDTYFWIDHNGKKINREEYSCLWVSAEALGMSPQIFVRQSRLDSEQPPVPVEEVKDTLCETKVDTVPTEWKEKKKEVRIVSSDWRKVARSNPFYEEAMKVISGELEEGDAASRRKILDYVEHLRTSYITRDIDFLNQLFSENALIIVGTVVYSLPQGEDSRVFRNQVKYSVRSKKEYLERLREVFRQNHDISLQFSDFQIMRHPSVPDIYGVTLHQKYHSDSYSDDGYLFLLWDFRDHTAPKIHVRTWQPGMQNGMTPLPESEIININQFNLN